MKRFLLLWAHCDALDLNLGWLLGIRGKWSNTGGRFPPRLFGFPLLVTIPPLFHTHLSPPLEVCDSPKQAAHYHIFRLKFGASSLIHHVSGYRVREMCINFSLPTQNVELVDVSLTLEIVYVPTEILFHFLFSPLGYYSEIFHEYFL
jgi:hypothetical protein